jgi:hypothetical protein
LCTWFIYPDLQKVEYIEKKRIRQILFGKVQTTFSWEAQKHANPRMVLALENIICGTFLYITITVASYSLCAA